MYEMAKTDSKWLDFPHSQRHRYNKIFNHIYKYTYQLIWGRLESTQAKVDKIRQSQLKPNLMPDIRNNESVELDSSGEEEGESDMTVTIDQQSRADASVKDGDDQGAAFGIIRQQPQAQTLMSAAYEEEKNELGTRQDALKVPQGIRAPEATEVIRNPLSENSG